MKTLVLRFVLLSIVSAWTPTSLFLPSPAQAQDVKSELFATGFSAPVFVTSPPGDTNRLFVVEQGGRIKIVDRSTGDVNSTPFLNVSGQLRTGGERGLLGLAFHPDYADNGLFYLNMSVNSFAGGDHATNIREYRVSAGNPDVADANSGSTILRFTQPFGNHNGGWIDFGPNDGLLYIATGDGGSGNDPQNNAKDITNKLLGKMLRIDVNGDDFPGDSNRDYAIPQSNPFVGVAGDDEIWAYGLRNPWRNSFDRATGDLIIGDVGQNAREEIDFQRADSAGGENYGWRLREGTIATPGVGGNPPQGAVEPVYDYGHGGGTFEGHSVTGGYVYRGPIASLRGQYFFGDYSNNKIWSIEIDRNSGELVDGSRVDRTEQFGFEGRDIPHISSFGEDDRGNLYIVSHLDASFRPNSGSIYRIVLESTIVGDLTGDGFVDFDDLTLLLAHWNEPDATQFEGNLVDPENTSVDFQDLTLLLAKWTGPGPAGAAAAEAQAVPEPSGMLLALVGMLCLFHQAATVGRARRAARSP